MAAVEPVTCASCGTINRPGAFFCAECGAALTREKPTSKQRTTYALSADDVKKALSTKIELPYTLPFAAGESPCMVKGGTYAGIMKQLATRVSGGIRNILPVIKDQGLTEFLSQRFLPGSYYDIFPLPIAGPRTYAGNYRDSAGACVASSTSLRLVPG